ncbi:MAG: hypothetical protein HY900_28120 [Deltaproteobacteria bacterium]|nr:hypothetical protein [Deltaproteobacteria bacterium]
MGERLADRSAWVAWVAVGLCLATVTTASSAPAGRAGAATPSVLLVTTTDDCPCTLDRCKVARHEIDKFLGDASTKFSLEVIDVSKKPDAAKTYKALILPAAILRDPTGTQIARFDGFFTEADILQAWARHLEAKGKKR